MRHPKRAMFTMGAAALLLIAIPQAASTQQPGPASIDFGSEELSVAEREAYWHTRASEARERVAVAEARLMSARAEVSRMRSRNHPRGEPRAALFAERDAAQEAFDDAVRALEVDLPRAAREANAPRAWLAE